MRYLGNLARYQLKTANQADIYQAPTHMHFTLCARPLHLADSLLSRSKMDGCRQDHTYWINDVYYGGENI